MSSRAFNTLAKSIWSISWVIYVFFMLAAFYKCNLRACMVRLEKEKPVDTIQVCESAPFAAVNIN